MTDEFDIGGSTFDIEAIDDKWLSETIMVFSVRKKSRSYNCITDCKWLAWCLASAIRYIFWIADVWWASDRIIMDCCASQIFCTTVSMRVDCWKKNQANLTHQLLTTWSFYGDHYVNDSCTQTLIWWWLMENNMSNVSNIFKVGKIE